MHLSIAIASNDLEKFFSYYETIPKPSFHLPSRIKRSSNHHSTFNIHFKQKDYQLVLSERVTDVTSEDFKVYEVDEDGDKKIIFPQYNLFHGSVKGENNSRIAAMFGWDGKLDMVTMQTTDAHLVVEPMTRYKKNVHFEDKRNAKHTEEYIIYSSKDVTTLNSKHNYPCSTTDASDIQRNIYHNKRTSNRHIDPFTNTKDDNIKTRKKMRNTERFSDTDKQTKRNNENNVNNDNENNNNENENNNENNDNNNNENNNDNNNENNNKIKANKTRRTKRRTKREPSLCSSADHKVCELMMVVDYDFYRDIGNEDSGVTTRLVISLVDMVNNMFSDVKFGDCGSGFVFRISRMDIHPRYNNSNKHFNHNSPHISPRTLLQYFGYTSELKEHCLGHLLTAKAFPNDTLGLSNVANPDMKYKYRVSRGGVCSNQCTTILNQKTFANTGLTTFKNSYVDRIPSLQAALVFAHELAHSLGSEHDETASCSPNHYPGKFLMYKYAVSGFEPNNKRLSVCSRKKITQVLRKKAQYCFKASKKNFCGNHKVEEGEECDEGMVQGDNGVHHCCDLSTCRLKENSECSDLNHDCCHRCKYASNITVCSAKDKCHSKAYCSGSSTACGEAKEFKKGEECITGNGENGKCRGGECVILCHYDNLDTCLCQGEDSCKVCCKKKDEADNDNHEEEYDDEEDGSGEEEVRVVSGGEVCKPMTPVIMLSNGTACSNGFCFNGLCREAKGGILNRLWEIMRINDISQFGIFVKNNIVGIIIFISTLIWAPAMCLINRYDKRQKKMELRECRNYSIHSNDLVSSTDKCFIKKANGVRKKDISG